MQSELEHEIEEHREKEKRPGELGFSIFLLVISCALLWNAYGIAGFSALSSPGAIPLATAFVMVVTSIIVVFDVVKLPLNKTETFSKDILPKTVIVFIVMLVAFGFLLHPLGFIPSAALFLILSIKYLSRRSWWTAIWISLLTLLIIWLVFRIVFVVLMPTGIVPEGEIIQYFRNMVGGA